MIDHKALANLSVIHVNHTSPCRIPLSSNLTDENDNELTNGPFAWSKHTQSIVLGSFFWGYVFQIFGGIFVAKLGSKKILAICVFVSSISTLLLPAAAYISYYLVVILRMFTGLAQGLMYPSCLPLISSWSPTHERSTLSSLIGIGTSLGIITATAITGKFCKFGFWYLNFVSLGNLSLIYTSALSYRLFTN
jgi:MFS family permease